MNQYPAPSRAPLKQQRESISDIAIPILVIHLLAFLAFLPTFFSWWNVLLLIICTLIFGQGINLGYHRLLSHKSLVVPKWLEYIYVMLALCSLEETPGKWVSTHRRHHQHSDGEQDPHSPTHGWIWSHFGWLLRSRNGVQEFRHDQKNCADIDRDPFYQFLERNPLASGLIYLVHAGLFFGVAYLVAFLASTPDPVWVALSAVMWGVLLRTVVVWHISWSVNSLTHIFGYRNYETGEKSRNNWLVALISSGEGWHNNHHHDPVSANNRHRWWEIDLTYCHIRVLEFLGLAKEVKRPRFRRSPVSDQKTTPADSRQTPNDPGTQGDSHGNDSPQAAGNPS